MNEVPCKARVCHVLRSIFSAGEMNGLFQLMIDSFTLNPVQI